MKSVSLTVFPREVRGRSPLRRLRASGRVPAVLYGRQKGNKNLEVNRQDIEKVIHHSATENVLVDLALDGKGDERRLSLIKDVQHHPLTGQALHVDFHEVAQDEKVTITLPVESTGEAVGVKVGGGVLEHVLFKVKVRALPKDLPEVVEVDVSHLNVGEVFHIGDIKAPEGVEILGDKQIPVLTVAGAKTGTEEEGTASGEAGPSEPEMIKEKKEEKKK